MSGLLVLTVINCILWDRKRTPVSMLYTGYELSIISFFKVFKPMWSLILQKRTFCWTLCAALGLGMWCSCGEASSKSSFFHLLVISPLSFECHRFPFKLILL